MGDLDSTRVFGEPGGGLVAIGLARHPLNDLFHALVTGSWARLLAVFALVYFATQALIGAGHYLLGPTPEALPRGAVWGVFLAAVPGAPAPAPGVDAHAVAAAALTGLQGFLRWLMLAVGSGIIFTKFSLLKPRVLFSKVAVVAPYDHGGGGGRALLFRMANERSSPIVDAKLQAMLVVDEPGADGEVVRRVHDLPLARAGSALFTHAWTAVHPIGRDSPLAGHGARTLAAANGEVIVTLTGFDEALLRTTHARHVYPAKAIRFQARFRDIVRALPNGLRAVDYRKFHDVVAVEEPPAPERSPARRLR
jgi:inward rectifier potassium channel